jgi:hypothetical protein
MIFRKKRDINFTVINNDIFEDNKLSLPAIGLLCYLLSKPEIWDVSPKILCKKLNKKEHSKASYEYILEVLKELENAQYLYKKKLYDGRTEYFVYDEPNRENTYLGNSLIGVLPNREKPNRENDDTNKELKDHKELKEKKKEKNSPKSSKEYFDSIDFFNEFWEIYPRKEAKLKSAKKFEKLSKAKKLRIIEITKIFAADMESLNRTRATIMLPSTYLNDERYEDYSENTELSKTNEGAKKGEDMGESRSNILAEKIIKYIKNVENEGDESKLNEKVYIEETFFDSYELGVLKELDYTFLDFKGLEYKQGEIKRYLGGLCD